MRKARRKYIADTDKLAEVFSIFPLRAILCLQELTYYYIEHEHRFDLDEFLGWLKQEIPENNFSAMSEILRKRASYSTTLRLLGLLRDALDLAAKKRAAAAGQAA